MSNSKKITDLAAYTDSQVQSNDLLFITDIAAQETKKITAIDIADYAFNAKSASIFNGNYTGSFTGSFSGSFTGNLTGTSSWATNALVADSVSGGTGEINTASNTGSYGYGLVSNKVGVDLRFKQIGAGNNINVDLDTVDGNVLKISALSTLTSPGGGSGNVQFNSNAGTFGGNSNLSWDTTTNNKLTVAGNVYSTNFSSSITNAVGYFGTASFAISSSNVISSSYALSSSHSKYAITASYLDGALPTLVQAQNNSGQSIGNNVANPSTTVTGWTNMYTQNATEWNATTGVFTATKAGTYLVSANLTYAAKSAAQTANVVNVQVVKNSTSQAVSTMAATNTTTVIKGTGTATSVVNVAAGDTITIRTYQDLGSAALLSSTVGLNNITIQEIPSRITR